VLPCCIIKCSRDVSKELGYVESPPPVPDHWSDGSVPFVSRLHPSPVEYSQSCCFPSISHGRSAITPSPPLHLYTGIRCSFHYFSTCISMYPFVSFPICVFIPSHSAASVSFFSSVSFHLLFPFPIHVCPHMFTS
jgi:hypothetical protein